jgi:capsular polysaccharide biosynthesis protein
LEAEHITSINVIQPASFVEKPVSPRKLAGLVGGFCLALATSMGWIVLREMCDQTLRTPEQVESTLGIPVLVSVLNHSLE